MIPPCPWLELRRELASVSIDPATKYELAGASLSAGTRILDGIDALRRADLRQLATLTVLVCHADGWLGFARVDASALRHAIA
jgi:hypothetical protein